MSRWLSFAITLRKLIIWNAFKILKQTQDHMCHRELCHRVEETVKIRFIYFFATSMNWKSTKFLFCVDIHQFYFVTFVFRFHFISFHIIICQYKWYIEIIRFILCVFMFEIKKKQQRCNYNIANFSYRNWKCAFNKMKLDLNVT